VVDIQECPKADLALVGLFSLLLKELIEEKYISYEEQKKFDENNLAGILLKTIKNAEFTMIDDIEYLKAFGVNSKISAGDLWKYIYNNISLDPDIIGSGELRNVETILNSGTLASRIKKVIGNDLSRANLIKVYSRLADSLIKNEMFEP
jgi:carboxylate-amine ligase